MQNKAFWAENGIVNHRRYIIMFFYSLSHYDFRYGIPSFQQFIIGTTITTTRWIITWIHFHWILFLFHFTFHFMFYFVALVTISIDCYFRNGEWWEINTGNCWWFTTVKIKIAGNLTTLRSSLCVLLNRAIYLVAWYKIIKKKLSSIFAQLIWT